MELTEALKKLKEITKTWELRFFCNRFAIIVDKQTGEYINLYREEFSDPFVYKIIPHIMEHHKNYKRG